MEKFNQLLNGIYYLRDFIPLNLFMLDNRIVNRVLEKLVRELKNFVTNYFVTLNQVENRRMCDEFEEMSINSGERPKETLEVVTLQNYLIVCREDKLFRLRSEIQYVKERVMFLLTYASLTRKSNHKFSSLLVKRNFNFSYFSLAHFRGRYKSQFASVFVAQRVGKGFRFVWSPFGGGS